MDTRFYFSAKTVKIYTLLSNKNMSSQTCVASARSISHASAKCNKSAVTLCHSVPGCLERGALLFTTYSQDSSSNVAFSGLKNANANVAFLFKELFNEALRSPVTFFLFKK
jgi:hypothetical protein